MFFFPTKYGFVQIQKKCGFVLNIWISYYISPYSCFINLLYTVKEKEQKEKQEVKLINKQTKNMKKKTS